MADIFNNLPDLLLPWYKENRRDLPWRSDCDPYHIWVSEIMLQQTRVEAVKGYYTRFLAALPTIQALAEADDELLHKLWEGLGYYSRVRNLKKAAKVIVDTHNGIFPRDYTAALALPGIGTYTAGAICSIAFNMPTPAVDGNVLRVVARLADDATPVDTPKFKAETEKTLAEIYPKDAGDFTQALMELGATVCGPNRQPDCNECPCSGICKGKYRASQLPVRNPKRARREENRTVFIARCDGYLALTKRPKEGLLAGLWQFPDVPERLSGQAAVDRAVELGFSVKNVVREVDKIHIFTHITWKMRGIYLECSDLSDGFEWMSLNEIRNQAALPTAYRQFFDE